MDSPEKIECRLCDKKVRYAPFGRFSGGINSVSEICRECRGYWEVGKKAEKAQKADGKEVFAMVKLEIKMDGRNGEPKGDTTIRAKDIIAAMGAINLRGTSHGDRFSGESTDIRIGKTEDYDGGSSQRVQVPKSRAVAMKKIMGAFLIALAKVRVDGFQEGRNLLLGLAQGTAKIDDFEEQSRNVAMGKRPRW